VLIFLPAEGECLFIHIIVGCSIAMGDSLMMDLLQSVLAAAYGGHFLSTEVEALSFSNPNLPLLSFPFRFVIDQPDEIDNSKKKSNWEKTFGIVIIRGH
jgi:hypothetical protein